MFEKSKHVLVSVIALALVLVGIGCVSYLSRFFDDKNVYSYLKNPVGFAEKCELLSTPFVSYVDRRAHVRPPIHSYGVSLHQNTLPSGLIHSV